VSDTHTLTLTGPVGATESRVHRLDPRAKLIGLTSVTLIAVTTPLSAWPVYVACALVLVAVALDARVPALEVWRRARVALPLVVAAGVFLPFVRPGGEEYVLGPLTIYADGLTVFAQLAIKASIGTVAAILLGATTSVPDLLRGLERLRAPRLLVLTAAFMYRYLFLIAAEARGMRAALTARAYRPRHALQAAAIGRVVASLFLRSHARGERVYLAMLSRGYTGAMPRLEPLTFERADVVFVALVLVALVPLRVASS
jgi:cobalt/nickel transport system permease protein